MTSPNPRCAECGHAEPDHWHETVGFTPPLHCLVVIDLEELEGCPCPGYRSPVEQSKQPERLSAPPCVGEQMVARLDDGQIWTGHVVRFSEKLADQRRYADNRRDWVEREIVLSLDPDRNVRLGKSNAGVGRWHRKLTACLQIGAEYSGGWLWMGGSKEVAAELSSVRGRGGQ